MRWQHCSMHSHAGWRSTKTDAGNRHAMATAMDMHLRWAVCLELPMSRIPNMTGWRYLRTPSNLMLTYFLGRSQTNDYAPALLSTVFLYWRTSLYCHRYGTHVVATVGSSVVHYAGELARLPQEERHLIPQWLQGSSFCVRKQPCSLAKYAGYESNTNL